MKIYILYGSTGEYEDYELWIVAIYKDESKCKERLDNCIQWAEENKVLEMEDHRPACNHEMDGHYFYKHCRSLENKNPYDERMDHIDYTGISYWIEEEELEE
jgi:hypothetical protein